MKNIQMALRSFFKKGKGNLVKILSLGIGLAMGLVLISKIMFEYSYDNFYPDQDRIYQIQVISMKEEEPESDGQPRMNISGGVAPGMQREIPEVEVATRFLPYGSQLLLTPDKKKYWGQIIMADENLFDVLSRPVLAGDAKDILKRPLYAIVSESMAEKMGGIEDALHTTFEFDVLPGVNLTIGGVFKDLPENTHWKYDVIISLETITSFAWDGRENWGGNDVYKGYVKLYPGVNPEELSSSFRAMQGRHVDLDALKRDGIDYAFTLMPVADIYRNMPGVKSMALLLGALAFALLFTAVMNYILIVISALVIRTKEVAVHKCYGAEGRNISSILLSETFIHLVFSLLLAVLLVYTFRGTVEELLGNTLKGMISTQTILVLSGVCILVFFISGFVPSYLFDKIPVAAAFRHFSESRRHWKLGLLFIQLVGASSLVVLLAIIVKQYNMMINDNPGYEYENLLYCNVRGTTSAERIKTMDELRRLPEVTGVSSCEYLPIYARSGNGVFEIGSDTRLFTFNDLYEVDEHYFDLLKIPVLEGKKFERSSSSESEMMVSRAFAEKITAMLGWEDGVVGKSVWTTEHGPQTIIGVYENIITGSAQHRSDRPTVMFYNNTPATNLLINLNCLERESISKIMELLETSMPEKNIELKPYRLSVLQLYESSRLFRNAVMIGGLVTLIISLIGVIGYVNDEVNRRGAEIAIRKINGGTIKDILRLFVSDIFKIAFPALVLGGTIAVFIALRWLENFSEKTTLTLFLFFYCALLLLSAVFSVVVLNSYRTAVENPVKALRKD